MNVFIGGLDDFLVDDSLFIGDLDGGLDVLGSEVISPPSPSPSLKSPKIILNKPSDFIENYDFSYSQNKKLSSSSCLYIALQDIY